MKVIENKYVVIDKLTNNFHVAYEMEEWRTNKKKLNKWFFIKSLMFNKRFFSAIQSTIKYALTHEQCYRGSHAAEVHTLHIGIDFKKLWREDED